MSAVRVAQQLRRHPPQHRPGDLVIPAGIRLGVGHDLRQWVAEPVDAGQRGQLECAPGAMLRRVRQLAEHSGVGGHHGTRALAAVAEQGAAVDEGSEGPPHCQLRIGAGTFLRALRQLPYPVPRSRWSHTLRLCDPARPGRPRPPDE